MTNQQFYALIDQCFAALPGNSVHLPAEDVDIPVLDAPLVGIARADDPLFEKFREPEVIGPEWRAPREWMPEARTTAAFFFPFTEAVRSRARASKELTNEAWNTAYGSNFKLVDTFLDLLVPRLEAAGVKVVQPNRDPGLQRVMVPTLSGGEEDVHFSVSWSNRHVCFAAGLGTFGVHRHLITDKGCCGTLASFIMDADLVPTERTYTDVYEYCTRCGACTKRCPASAITLEHLRNLKKCSAQGGTIREKFGSGFCGKCLVGVPCEHSKPTVG